MESKAANEREPCPDRILDDVGGGFAIGSVGGSLFYFLKGVKNSPRGERFVGGIHSIRMKTPRLAGSFAVWSGVFSSFDCSLVYLRRKEDPWNSILAGAATGGFLQMRRGLRATAGNAVTGGLLFAFIEGAQLLHAKMLSGQLQPPIFLEDLPGEAQAAPAATSGSSWFGDWFKKEEKKNGAEPVVLESDAPIRPTFDF